MSVFDNTQSEETETTEAEETKTENADGPDWQAIARRELGKNIRDREETPGEIRNVAAKLEDGRGISVGNLAEVQRINQRRVEGTYDDLEPVVEFDTDAQELTFMLHLVTSNSLFSLVESALCGHLSGEDIRDVRDNLLEAEEELAELEEQVEWAESAANGGGGT